MNRRLDRRILRRSDKSGASNSQLRLGGHDREPDALIPQLRFA